MGGKGPPQIVTLAAGDAGDVLYEVGEAGGGSGWGDAESRSGCVQIQVHWGILNEELQKHLVRSGVQTRNCGGRHKIEIVGIYVNIVPQSTHLEKVGGRR